MKVFYILLTLSLLLWKAYHVWLRGMHTYCQDRSDHDSLREYLLGNGATELEALHPFMHHAIVRAFRPLLTQWRLLIVLVVLALLAALLADGLTVWQSLGLLAVLLAVVMGGTLLSLYLYMQWKK